ncbi:MAG: PQQ-binding-like beta-propeller repeat protein, partial [Candidatus Hydrogenedentes bacterium]|nr:PQQ-binding-like beta-propeller repeat protein [Candidatus Hydrogenedentota bacterium]
MYKQLLILTAFIITLSPAMADDSLVAHWRFDEAALIDGQFQESQHGAHAKLEGPTAFGGTGQEKAALVSRNDTKLTVNAESAAPLLPKDTLTVSVWLNIERTVEWADILGAAQRTGGLQKGWTLGFRQSNFSFGLSTAGADDGDGNMTYARSLSSLEWGKWYHVVGTYDGSTQRLYVNGELVAEDTTQSGAILYPEEAPIVFAGGTDGGWRGWLYESNIYNRTLSAEEVQTAYAAKRDLFPTALHVKVGPYLQRIDSKRIRIAWETEVPSQSTWLWGDTLPLKVVQSSDEKRKQHTVFVEALTSDSRYWYRVAFEDKNGVTQYTRLHEFDATFDYTPVRVTAKPFPYENGAEQERFSALAEQILSETGITNGYALVIGAGKGRLAYELAWQSDLQIICIDDDPKRVQEVRRALDATGIYGVKVSVIQADLNDLPTTQYVANLVVSESLLDGQLPGSIAELNRVTRPAGGKLWLQWDGNSNDAVQSWLEGTESGWQIADNRATFTRPKVPGAGEWTHQYGHADNAANSQDGVIGGEMQALWYGEPGPRPMVDRGTRSPAPLSANGRLFVQGDRRLFGIDAFNGTIYWDLEIPDLRRANMPRDGSNMVVNEDTLYAAVRDRCWILEGQTGALKTTFSLPEGYKEDYDWGYIASEGDTLYGSAVKRGGLFVGADGEWYDKRGDESQKVISDVLFAMDKNSGELLWTREGGGVVNSTITLGGDRLFFIESRSEAVKALKTGRAGNEISTDRFLVSMDAKEGGALWDRPYDQTEATFVMYLMYSEDRLVAVNSSNRWDLYAYGTSDGEFIWEQHYEWVSDNHGGAMTHPAIMGDMVVAEP